MQKPLGRAGVSVRGGFGWAFGGFSCLAEGWRCSSLVTGFFRATRGGVSVAGAGCRRNQSCALDATVMVKPHTRPTAGDFGGDAVSLGLAELLPQYLRSVAGCLRLARGSGAPSLVSVWCRAVLASLVPPGSGARD